MAGQEVRGMLIRLEATTAQLRQEMAKADTTVAQVAGRIDSQLGRVDSAFDRAGASAQAAAGILKGALAGVVGTAGITELLKHAEAYTTIANRLKLVTTGAAEFTAAQNAVFDIAQRSGQPLTATAELYQRIATNQKELKLTGRGVAGIVETISKTMVISGASTESANAALIQLGQAFASGTLRGEELNSVLEQAPALAQAIAKGMGVSVGALRSLGAAGKLTADSVVKALQAQAGAVNELFGKMQSTVSQGMTKLDNSATNLIGKLDQTSGVSQKLSGVLTSVSKSLDAVSADGASLADTVDRVTSVAEKLAIVIGARLVLAAEQSLVAFLASTAAAIKQAAALTQSTIAADRAVRADAASAAQTLLTAQSRQADAKAMLERANVELATAEQKVAADRIRQASEVANLQAVQTALVAERGLEEQRLRAQITDTGRAQSIARIVELRQSEIAITNQVRAAETALAETSVATSAQIQAAYQRRAAAAGAYGETTLAVNEAVAASEKTAAAASVASRGIAGLSAAGGGLLALLTGPVGMIATVALVAASFIDFGSSTEKASKALLDHGLSVDQATQKYKELSAEQQRFQILNWEKDQKTALEAAASALNDYSVRAIQSLSAVNKGSSEYQQQFQQMIAEVKDGKRSLDSVTAWAKENTSILPVQIARLTELSSAYSGSTKEAAVAGDKIRAVGVAAAGAATNTDKLTVAQQNSGQTDASKVAWDKYIEQLTKTRDLLGANAAAEAAYTAAKMGATPAQAAQAKIIADQTDTLKKYQEAIKQSAEAEKVRLRAQLVALYTAEDAQNAAAAAQKKAFDDTATAAESSSKRQITAIEQAANFAVVSATRVALGANQPQKNLTGYSLLTNGGTAPVVPAKPKATPDQRADAAVAQLDATTEANKRVDKAASKAAQALAAQKKALEDLLAKSGIATKASNDIADAYLAGADNVRDLTIKQEIETEVLKTGSKAYDQVAAAVNAMHDAKDREDVMKRAAEMGVEIDNLKKEAVATLQGQAAVDAFNVTKSVQAELIGKKIAVGSKEYDQLVAATKAQLDNNKALEQANEANSIVDRLYPQTKLLRDYTRELEALNKAMDLDKDHADAYRDAIARLSVEYEQNQRAATAWGQFTEGAVDRIDGAFADMWKSILSKSGNFMDTLKDSFRQFLAEMLHMAITKPIIVQIGASLGVGTAAAQSSGLFGSAGGSGGLDLASLWNAGSTAFSVGSSAFGSAVAAGWSAGQGFLGGVQGAISGGSGYLSNAIGGLFSSGVQGGAGVMLDSSGNLISTAAGGATALGGTLAGVGGALYGYGQSGVKGAATGAAGSVGGYYAGSALGSLVGPLGTVVGGVLGSALGGFLGGSIFGGSWQTKDQGLSLGVTGGDLSAAQFEYQKKKGGLFGSNKKRTRYSALDSDTQAALDDSYAATTGAVFDLFDKLNVTLNDGVLDGLNVSATQISTKGKTADEIQAEITKWFAGVADSVTSAINTATGTGLDGYNFEALTAFVNNLYGVNDVFTTLNMSLYDSSVSGGKLAESLSAMAGGLANLQAAASTYYDNFYTDIEKADNVLAAVNKQFAGLNIDFPDTRQAFRDTVDGLDRTTEAGQQMFVTLTSLAANAASAYTILEQRSTAAQAAAQAAADAAAAVSANYYDLFTSDAQKSADKLAGVRDEFKALGVELPATREAFMQMVYAAQLGTVAGKATADALMGLATDADAAYKILQAALTQGATDGFSAVQRSINAQKASINDMLATANTRVSDLTGISSGLSAALKSLRGDSDAAVKTLRSQAQATLQSALAIARAGGSLAGYEGLTDALDTVSDNNTDLYSSLEDFNRDQGRTANVVAELNKLNGKQLTSAEQTVKTLQDQLTRLDDQLNFAQQQLDALNGLDNTVLSVTDAVNAMNAAVVASLAGMGGKGATNSAATNGTLIDSVYKDVLGLSGADSAGKNYWLGELANGHLRLDQLAQAIANAAKENNQAVKAGYATGGYISGPGNGTSDSIVARLSNGEYVMTAQSVRMFGTGLLDQMNAGRIPAFAAGGPVLSIPSIRSGSAPSAARVSSSDAATIAELRALRDEIRNGLAVIADHARKTSDNTGQLAEVGTQVVGVVQTKATV
ncbi:MULTISPECIES: tape measure protein [unclassified Pseudomonas]|uniref:tape measure protein n=1 Tax=unclassified Pseudomonas TaxID=196821 RepID=UPI0025E228BF|nr:MULTISPECIES: tape measure protein [unclassified Pseudomonas]